MSLLNRFRHSGQKDTTDRRGVLFKTVVFSLIFFAILLLTVFVEPIANPSPIQVFIAFIPLIAWLIVSGQLSELTTPGGFKVALNAPLPEVTEETRIDVDKPFGEPFDPSRIEGDSETLARMSDDFKVLSRIVWNEPTVLLLRVKNEYDEDILELLTMMNIRFNPNFQYVLFVDQNENFSGLIASSDFARMFASLPEDEYLNGSSTGNFKFLSVSNDIRYGDILADPRVITESITPASTNREALDRMNDLDLTVLPVVYRGLFLGTVTQDQIVRSLLL